MSNKKKKAEENDKKYQDNAFQEAQENASDGKGPNRKKAQKEKKPSKKAKDELLRAKEADKEWSSESDEFRRDNA
ncbi:MAG: hypothetical protein WDZ72_11665 [Cyclobacteriaceae bacterium]